MAKRAGQFRSGDLPLGMLSHFKRTQHQRLVSRGRRWAIFAILAAPAFNACRDKASPYAPLAVGAPVPAFAASTLDGQEISLASLKGKPVVLNIWATWCGPCRREMPLLDSLSRESAARGICWLFNQKPCLGVFLALWNLLVFSLFGGAVCRSAAVQSARDESISAGEALRFVRERYSGFVLGPLLPVGVVVLIGIFMFLGGLFGAIGYVGELVTGVFYPLALMGGFGAALIVLVTIVAFHLMWPTIAVEGSDGFDALSRACSYVGSRIWHVGFYWFVLLLYGAASFVLVRAVAMVTLKLAHKLTGVGMNLISSAELSGTGKLDAMWSMPAWSDLSFVPGRNTMPLWGSFFNGPLDGTEWLGAWLIALWVFLFIGLLGAFVLNFFFCGSTQVYFLLRRDVDATDWDEIYYEEPEEPAPVPTGESGPAPQVPTAPAEPPPPADSADPPPQS
ncbi:MAG TPA: TlpA disulfide reductase family protein [Phycisphaerae bacterium]|nr:TlpA disulfide reductase family protein [Phycisphaerae bacterium]